MISVVIPVYNELYRTKQIIDNLKLFMDEPYEIVVVDDGSTDGTEEWIAEKNIDNLRYFKNDKNRGVTYSWNRGVAESHGEYIMVINNDIKFQNPKTISFLKALADIYTIACPYFFRRHEEKLNMNNGDVGIDGFCFMFRRSKSLFPIDDRLKIFYNDNWLFHKAQKDVGRGGSIRHYESQTVNSKTINKKQQEANYKKVSYWMEQDAKTWEKILDENNWR